eukprot:Skav209987  [mRNA]  locus=scaffold1046:413923:416430:+ [translate_table: standard]
MPRGGAAAHPVVAPHGLAATEAGKGKKGKQLIEAAQREARSRAEALGVEQWDYELREKHREELEALTEFLNGATTAPAEVLRQHWSLQPLAGEA